MLKGKVAIVTGGTRGIGYAIVRKYLENGATCVLCGSREETANKALTALKEEYKDAKIKAIWPDLSDYDDVKKNFDEVIAEFGKIDILVNNAGISAREPITDYKV